MNELIHAVPASGHDLDAAVAAATHAIPPAWPLEATVAVNPFLAQTDEDLATVAVRIGRVAGVRVTMPRAWYREQMTRGVISEGDLIAALAAAPSSRVPIDLATLKDGLRLPQPELRALETVAELAATCSGTDWPGLIADRFGAWAAGYFDQGQALWAAPRGHSAYASWRAVATHDLTPEIQGLEGFASHIAQAPEHAEDAIERVVDTLAIPPAAQPMIFHRLLMTLGGWAQLARHELWMAELGGRDDAILKDFLAIRLLWEEALFLRHADAVRERWRTVLGLAAAPVAPGLDETIDAILQEALERSEQRRLAALLTGPAVVGLAQRPVLQAAFCIDVRSEVFRRALEACHGDIQTLGFAGFFGIRTAHRRFASDVSERRLPVLLNPSLQSSAGGAEHALADATTRVHARATRAWGRFRLAAVSSFAFVEATGPVYAAKLLGSALGLAAKPAQPEPMPRIVPTLPAADAIASAEAVLRGMSLTRDFARLVLLLGHGATVVNNPHASGLQCGACGGYSGEVNARLLAGLLNDPVVRQGLALRDITIPDDTLFVAGLHDTTTDEVTLYVDDQDVAQHRADLERAHGWLAAAALQARSERAARLPHARDAASVLRRARDWSEIRPEWALAGCSAFIAAPRTRTRGRLLHGRAFLHDYDWQHDQGFGVLELILTAPVVVASWISLQYYGSTVAPEAFGAGNKLLHNVTGGVGVVEGNGGLLRAGLPWQSVHDGRDFSHTPLRLAVCIEAPREAISAILARHAGVRALFDHRWLHLFALDAQGRMAWRYAGGLEWRPIEAVGLAGAGGALKMAV